MILLGSERSVTQDFKRHGYAEDYSGEHLSNIRFNGVGKVINVVNKFKCHEDSINKNDYNSYKSSWKDGDYYNCVSITGKKVRYHKSELGGNSVTIESYDNGVLLNFKILHMADVYVKAGDIINTNTLIGIQGNTGLVLSSKDRSNPTYGTHVHYQITDASGNNINPRKYATGAIVTNYITQSNNVDTTKNQFKVLVPKVNIRELSTVNSKDMGDVFKDEIYTILDSASDEKYDWYKITTNTNITGWVANEKGYNWLEIISVKAPVVEQPKEEAPKEEVKEEKVEDTTEVKEDKENKNETTSEDKKYNLIFTCTKTDLYAINLNEGEKLYIVKNK